MKVGSSVCLLVVARLCQGGMVPKLSALEAGFGGDYFASVSEDERLALRRRAGWPDDWNEIPNESPGYRKVQEERFREILALEDMQERLDNIVQHAQTRIVQNFTELGFKVVDETASEIHARLLQKLLEKKSTARLESKKKMQGIYGPKIPKFVDHYENSHLMNALQPHLEAWSQTQLQPVTAYGMRVYERGSSLAWHADRVDTHVISAIFHIGHHYDNSSESWPIEIEAHDGKRYAVDLKPGQALFYESAKCPHGRSLALVGDFYASVFIHFKPVAWPYTTPDVWLSVPPKWDAPPIYSDRGPGLHWAGAFLTHTSMLVAGSGIDFSRQTVQDKKKTIPPLLRSTEKKHPPAIIRAVKHQISPEEEHISISAPSRRYHHVILTEAASLLAGVGVFGLLYTLGCFAILSTLGFAARRAWLTRGRSLVRSRQLKKCDDSSLFHFDGV